MTTYNKLVRDNLVDIMLSEGFNPEYRELSESETEDELNKKLQEEVDEYLKDRNIEEIADIIEVIRAILELKGYSIEDAEEVRKKKELKKGAFKKRIFLFHD